LTGAKDTLYYDGQCGMCRRSVRVLKRLDWFGRLAYQDSTVLSDEELPVSRESSLTGMPMRTKDGETLLGFPAVRRAMRRTPIGFLPALILHIPGVSHVGRRVYDAFAAGRARDGVSCDVSPMHSRSE
jgi:predicted DCC family thiol-disulfide oxidoreductase YuxK